MKLIAALLGFAGCLLASLEVYGQNTSPTVAGPGQIAVEANASKTIGYPELVSLSGAQDADGDLLQIYITALVTGKMTKNGAPIVMGETTVSAGEEVVWTAPTNAYNGTIAAFKVRVSDGVNFSATAATINAVIRGNTPPVLTAIDPFLRSEFRHALKNTPYSISFAQLFQSSDLLDIDNNPLSFVLGTVVGGSLTRNGVPAIPGQTVIAEGDALTWTPTQAGSLVTAFTVFGFDGQVKSSAAVPVRIDVIDPTPVFTKGLNITVPRTSLDNVVWNWAKNIGPVGGALQFEVTNDNPGLFAYPPEITPEGTLIFSLDGIQYGVANVAAVLVDDAGRRSVPQTFKITVGFVNYPPSFSLNSDVVVSEYLTAINTVPGVVTDIDRGAPNEYETVKFEVTTDSLAMFATKPTIAPNGTLTYRLAPTATGEAQVTVVANDGKLRSAPQSFKIRVPTSPFVQAKGVYTGLFFEDAEVRHESSGQFILNLTDRGACSGKLLVGGASLSFAGGFNIEGAARFPVKRKDGTSLQMSLDWDGTQIVGQIADATWVAKVVAEKPVAAAGSAGQYTMVLSNGTAPLPGNGAFAFTVSSNGQVAVTGSLADGAKVSHSAAINSRMQFPFYRSLYGGRGSVIGWVSVSSHDIGGTMSWSKGITDLASDPFVAEVPAIGSKFMAQTNAPVLLGGNRSLALGGGTLPTTSEVAVKISGLAVSGSGLNISVNAKTGLAGGTFIHPVSKLATKVIGAVLQNENALKGYFIEPTAVGAVSLEE